MKTARRAQQILTVGVAALAIMALGALSGCLITDGDSEGQHNTSTGGGFYDDCYVDCEQEEVCQSFCDMSGCFEDCYIEEICVEVCDGGGGSGGSGGGGTGGDSDRCYSKFDCPQGWSCHGGQCYEPGSDVQGDAGLCQNCQSRDDCFEDGALCLGLNYNPDTGQGETICSRACSIDSDCPTGFECLNVTDEPGASDQCVPMDGGEVGSCQAGGELECVSASDCGVAETCVNNTCQAPSDAECSDDAHCGTGERCEAYQCVDDSQGTQCVVSDDCSDDDAMCINGECVTEPQSCVFNTDCASSERCVNGECTATCSSNDDCGSSQRCRHGICEFIECYQTADCSTGEVCVEAKCEQTCSDNADCATGFRCSGFGYCEADPDVECRSSAECSADQICSDDGECMMACDVDDQC